MTKTVICGIDPGQRGAFALLDNAHNLSFITMPDNVPQMLNWLRQQTITHVFLEKAQSMPKQGVASVFTYGEHYGEIKGILATLGIPFTCVAPKTWTRSMHQGTTGASAKDKSRQAAHRLFPTINFVLDGCRKAHDGVMDAVLIAEYGLRQLPVLQLN